MLQAKTITKWHPTAAQSAELSRSMSACGAIAHGASQDIGFRSSPSAAKLTVDGVLKGQTSAVVPLVRSARTS